MDDRGHAMLNEFPRDETCNKYQGEAARARRARLVRMRRVEPLVGGQQLQHQPDIIPLEGRETGPSFLQFVPM